MRLALFLAACSVLLAMAGCEKKPQVVEKPVPSLANIETGRLGASIDAYAASPSESQAANVQRAFSELDGEIAELDQRIAKTSGSEHAEAEAKSRELHVYRDKEMARFTEAQARAKANSAAKTTGAKLETAADKVADGVKEAVDVVKEKVP